MRRYVNFESAHYRQIHLRELSTRFIFSQNTYPQVFLQPQRFAQRRGPGPEGADWAHLLYGNKYI